MSSIYPLATLAGPTFIAFGIDNLLEGKARKGTQKLYIGLTMSSLEAVGSGFSAFSKMKTLLNVSAVGLFIIGAKHISEVAKSQDLRNCKAKVLRGIGAILVGSSIISAINDFSTSISIHLTAILLTAIIASNFSRGAKTHFEQGNYTTAVTRLFIGLASSALLFLFLSLFINTDHALDNSPMKTTAPIPVPEPELPILKYNATSIDFENLEPTTMPYEVQTVVDRVIKDKGDGTLSIFNYRNFNLTKVGSGASKFVFKHPDLSGWVIKISKYGLGGGFRSFSPNGDLELDAANRRIIAHAVSDLGLRRLVVPESHIVEISSSKGVFKAIVEQQVENPYHIKVDEKDFLEIRRELYRLIKNTGLCDVSLDFDGYLQNLGIVEETKPVQLALIDVDCINAKSLAFASKQFKTVEKG